MTPPASLCLLLLGELGIFALGHFTKGQNSSTLIFTKGNTIRNCSCPVGVRDCDYSLASLMCSCKSVLPFAMEQTRYDHLTIWFTDASTLGQLLEFTLVQDLKLSLCGSYTLPTKYLAICGLQRLRISAEAKRPFREQSLLVPSRRDSRSSYKGWQTCMFISFLDMALFNRDSSLKSYSIDNVSSLTRDFPDFPYFKTSPIPNNKSCVVTIIY
ncbi:uncharacterized protein C21orf62 homolog [Cricetulus griseus]|nr:uncharacterized protein C21orf62 homolog [Cricetulus griseus]XP_035311165.1 uncharacterized protein C21orf62 homolog [Cricetulus griseus]ERE76710.1 hypothetical protein H671_4g11619 [Cricetulus griseus]